MKSKTAIIVIILSVMPYFDADAGHTDSQNSDIIYFILIDRFHDADSSNNFGNNPQSHLPCEGDNPNALKTFQGGDLKGVINKLDYLAELKVSTIWLSPFFDNSDNDYVGWWPYHGYHPIDFYNVDEHFGTIEDLKELVSSAHNKNIKVIFDLPFNQTAADHPWLSDSTRQGWYHTDPNGNPIEITDWFDQNQIEMGELHGLPDLAQENEEVYIYLLEMSKYWIDETGCDGFRLDAVKHIPKSFWSRFNQDIHNYAGDDFILLGEVFWGDAERITPYVNLGFTHLFDIPGYYNILNTFAKGGSMDSFAAQIRESSSLWANVSPVRLIDNHDVARFASGLTENAWAKQKLALTFILTMTGNPMLYYGSEIGLRGGPIVDPVTGAPQDYLNRIPLPVFNDIHRARFNEVKELISIRQNHAPLLYGEFFEVYKDWGVYGYLRPVDNDGVLIFLNSSDSREQFRPTLNGWEIKINAESLTGQGNYTLAEDVIELELAPLSAAIWPCSIIEKPDDKPWAEFTDRIPGDFKIVRFEYHDSSNRVESLKIAGDFNNWNPASYNQSADNYNYFLELPLRPGKYRYKFVINDNLWIPDPLAEKFELDPWGGKNSVVVVK